MKNPSMRSICYIVAACSVFFAAAGCRAKEIATHEKSPANVTTINVFGSEQVDPPATKIPEDSEGWTYETVRSNELPEEGTINGLNYKLIPSKTDGSSAEKGYYVFNQYGDDRPYKILIAAGKFNTGGYSIGITNIRFDGTTLFITVKETAPAPTDTVTQAFTFPCCAVEISKYPEEVKVTGEDGYAYQRLITRLDETEIKDGWIAKFVNGYGEVSFNTYVYENEGGRYKYVNVKEQSTSWGSTKRDRSVLGIGIVKTRQDVVEAAKNFGSCGYVMFPGDLKTVHKVSEFLAK